MQKLSSFAKRAGAVLAAAFVLVGTTGGGCRGRFGNMMSKSEEVKLGDDAAVQVDKQAKFITTGPQYDRLQRVAARILPLAHNDFDVPYTVKLIDSKEINAFAIPGGHIYFYRGLMDLAESDDEVAGVLGHESTHIVRRHTAKQISDSNAKGLIASILTGGRSQAVQMFANLAFQLDQLHYSRDDESEADENGFHYLTAAGYDPEAMASFFRKLQAKTGKGGPEWLNSHPLTNKRVEKAEERATAYRQSHPTSPLSTPPATVPTLPASVPVPAQ